MEITLSQQDLANAVDLYLKQVKSLDTDLMWFDQIRVYVGNKVEYETIVRVKLK